MAQTVGREGDAHERLRSMSVHDLHHGGHCRVVDNHGGRTTKCCVSHLDLDGLSAALHHELQLELLGRCLRAGRCGGATLASVK